MINLTSSKIIGEGNERICFLHPGDNKKVIKVTKKTHRRQNEIDYIYYTHLEKRRIDFRHLATCYGYTDTSMGLGLVFERVVNYDNSDSITLGEAVTKRLFSYEELKTLLHRLTEYLVNNNIILAENSLANILCKKTDNNSYELIVIDGIGSRNLGIQFWLNRHVSLLAKRKTIKKTKQLHKKIENFYSNHAATS